MALEIDDKQGDILPFRRIMVNSPKEARDINVIARGEYIPWYAHELKGMYNYLGPADDLKVLARGCRTMGPIINYDAPLGNEKAVIRKIDFPEGGIVYISRSGYSPSGSDMFGVWERVRENP